MAKFVRVAAVQFATKAVQPGSAAARGCILEELANILDQLKGYNYDLVVFSEGIEAYAQTYAEAEVIDEPGELLKLYAAFAKEAVCHVAGSLKIRVGEQVYNSIAFIEPAGRVLGAYHKTFLTDGELAEGLRSGKGALVVESSIGRLGGAICFDLNFPSLREEYRLQHPDIIAFASMYHGGLMQATWAYECRAFLISALPFHPCGILDPFGRPVAMTNEYESVASATLNLDRVTVHLDHNRDKFPALRKKYGDEVIIDIPPQLGSALIYSQTEKRTAQDIVAEFELESLDDYFARAVKVNQRNR